MLTDRYGGRLVFSLLLAFSALPAVLFGYAHGYCRAARRRLPARHRRGVVRGRRALRRGLVRAERQGFALGVYGMGNIGTAIAFFGAPPVSNHWGRPTVGWITASPLLAGAALFWLLARDAPARGGAGALRRGAACRLAAVPARVLLLHHLRRLRRDGLPAADAAAGLVRLLEGRGGRAGGRLHHRRDDGAARSAAGSPTASGAFPVLVLAFAGIAVDAAVLAALAPRARGSCRSRSPA